MRNHSAFLVFVISIACGSVTARAGVNHFTSISPEGAPISSMVVDPSNSSTIYSGTRAGVFKSIDAGETWTLSLDSPMTLPDGSIMERTIGALAIDPRRPSIVYAGTRTGEVMKTVDGGATWSRLAGIHEKGAILKLIVDPGSPETIYALSEKDLLQSEDEGRSWTSRATGLILGGYFRTMAIDPSQPSRLYVGTDGGLYFSSDRGRNWSLLIPGGPAFRVVVDPKDSANIYVGHGSSLLSTVDGGRNWTTFSVGNVFELVLDPVTSAVFALVTPPNIYTPASYVTTDDHGRTWKPWPESLPQLRFLAIDPTETHSLYGVSQGSLFKSENGGTNWRRLKGFTAPWIWEVAVVASKPTTLVAASESGVLRSTDSGKNWSDSNLNHTYAQLATDPRSSTIFVFNWESAVRSGDGGETWTGIKPGNGVQGIAVDPTDSAVVYAAHADGLSKSSDGGFGWTSVGAGQLPLAYYGFEGSAIAVDPVVPTTVYAAGNAGIVKSTDAGTTWRTIFTDPDGLGGWGPFYLKLVIDPETPSTIYSVSYNKVFRSDNAGQDWQVIFSRNVHGGYFQDLTLDPRRPSRLYLATTVGLFRSEDHGDEWRRFNEGLPAHYVNGVTVDLLGNVYAATSRGLFVNRIVEEEDLLPGASILSVSLQTHAGNFVSAEGCGGSFLHANAFVTGPCQTFTMFDLNAGGLDDGDTIHLRAADRGFVVAEGGGGANGAPAAVNANRAVPGEWETFVIHRVGGSGPIRSGDSISLRSWSGSFVAAEYGGRNGCQCDSRLNANRALAGVWERFVIVVH